MRFLFCVLISLLTLAQLGMTGLGQDYLKTFAQGKATYEKNCLSCHGVNGEGNGPDASTLMVPPANFQSRESRMKSERDLQSAVVWGLAFSPMHKWFDKLTVQEMREVVKYIRWMAPFRPRSD